MFTRIHHVAFVVADLETAMDDFEENYDTELVTRGQMESAFENSGRIDVALYHAGDNIVELIEPVTDEGWTYEILRENGEGFFHIAFEVDDIRNSLRELRARGIDALHDEPQQGFAWEVATLDHRDTLVPMQIVEETD